MSELETSKPAVVVNEKKSSKGKKKKAVNPATITPEYIEEQRRLRQLKKEQKKQELIAQGINPDQVETPAELRYKTRDVLVVQEHQQVEDGPAIRIMSYNMLAQALIRRKLFPTSGNALKWSTRSQVLLSEICHYNPDILCLQEVDFVQYNSFWKSEFDKLGYDSKYHRAGTKNHGLALVYRRTIFVNNHHLAHIQYDKEKSGKLSPSCVTQNIGLLACLDFTPQMRSKYPKLRNGLIVGTTHLFWHPFGTYERTRQTYVILKKFKEFRDTLNTLNGEGSSWYSFFAGDFNSQPFDTPYLSITSKPVKYKGRGPLVLGCSLSYQYSSSRGIVDDEDNDDSTPAEEEEGGNVEKYGKNQPTDPVPDTFEFTDEQRQKVEDMEALHNSLDMRAISLYSAGYHLVDPKNAGIDNDRKEPFFSNWAHTWRGLLDYIFIISSWNQVDDYSERIDSVQDIESEHGVKLLKLLQLPLPEEMGPEPSGQPRIGQYPSDHLCLMAEVALC
ncbi:RNA exonuclease Ngl2p [[Candida] anglica]|uniref:RNA exonuclease Ngl2p n=1 Tax=[Candida] anglica TaxID=148631 RepID=A0ABP0EA61_9ASCO